MDEIPGSRQRSRPRLVWVLLLVIPIGPIGFGHWYWTVALLAVSALMTYAFLRRDS